MTEVEQLPLFDESQLPAGRELLLPAEEQRQRFTAERVAWNQERYRAIVAAIAEGLSVRQICRAFSVSHHIVSRIREKEPALVATEKERLRGEFRSLVRLAADRLREALEEDKLSVSALPVALGILTDKSLALDGQPGLTVTVRHEVSQESVRAMFEDLAKGAIPVTLESVSGVQQVETPAINVLSLGVGTDVGTFTLGTGTTEPAQPGTSQQDDTNTPETREGGGGGRGFEGVPAVPMGSGSENLVSKE